MTMTDTEAKAMALVSIDPKALEHACLCAGRSVHHFDRMGDDLPLRASIVAHARAIERLEATEARHAAELREQAERFDAFRQDVSDAVEGFWNYCRTTNTPFPADLTPFILPAPDPLVEAFASLPVGFAGCVDGADALRAAMQARGYEWRKIGEAGE